MEARPCASGTLAKTEFQITYFRRNIMRPSGRTAGELRPVTLSRHYTRHAEGSVLIEFGHTKVLCNATFEVKVPSFLKGSGTG